MEQGVEEKDAEQVFDHDATDEHLDEQDEEEHTAPVAVRGRGAINPFAMLQQEGDTDSDDEIASDGE